MSNQLIRSPSYPSLSLEAAVKAVRKIDEKYRTAAVDRKDAAGLIGFSSLSGPANKALAALAAYGLVERAGKGDMRVTELARAILYPDTDSEKLAQLQAAASAPPLFQKIRERFPDLAIPPKDGLINYLNREGFNPSVVNRAANAFLDTAAYLEKERASDSHGRDSDGSAESPVSGASENAPDRPAARIGDLVQWESQGAWQLEEPRRVCSISGDGHWAFLEGSNTGVPMAELIVEEAAPRPSPPTAPPVVPLAAVEDHSEIEWLRSRIGTKTSVRLMVTGDLGATEVKRLIRVLDTQREFLEEDAGKQTDNNA